MLNLEKENLAALLVEDAANGVIMHIKLVTLINSLQTERIDPERRKVLEPLVDYILECKNNNEVINLNFICTHNSRRSHLTQIWAQTMAAFYHVNDVHCYSGGTEVTAVFPKVIETQIELGFDVQQLSDNVNPVYAVKYGTNSPPIVCFSKKFDHSFNPKSSFAAVMTCSSADSNCPVILGAERISVTYEDPKVSDNTPNQKQVYLNRSIQIATEMKYVFSKLATSNGNN